MCHLNSHSYTTGTKPCMYITFIKKQCICSVSAKYSLWHKYCQIAKVPRCCRLQINTSWDFKGDDVGQILKTQLASTFALWATEILKIHTHSRKVFPECTCCSSNYISIPGQNLQHQTGTVERKIYKIHSGRVCAKFRYISIYSVTC